MPKNIRKSNIMVLLIKLSLISCDLAELAKKYYSQKFTLIQTL